MVLSLAGFTNTSTNLYSTALSMFCKGHNEIAHMPVTLYFPKIGHVASTVNLPFITHTGTENQECK